MPDVSPIRRSPERMAHRFVLKDVAISASPRETAETTMVFLCDMRAERNPDPRIDAKYPDEMMRNIDPAWAWPMPRSTSIVGIRGAGMIRAMKFRKNREVMKRMGKMNDRNGAEPLFDGISTGVSAIAQQVLPS